MTTHHHFRRAFTLIELLIVIAIIGLLVGLIIPAVSRVRDLANRTTCINNLKQLALALQDYNSAHNALPPLYQRSTDPARPLPTHNLFGYLLAHLGSEAVGRQYNMTRNWYDNNPGFGTPTNLTVARTRIPTLQCPTSPSNEVLAICNPLNLTDLGPSDYCAVSQVEIGGDSAYGQNWMPGVTYNAALGQNQGLFNEVRVTANPNTVVLKPTTLSQVQDGVSQTIALVEDSGRPDVYVNGSKQTGSTSGSAWADIESYIGLHGFMPDGVTSGGPCAMNCTNRNEIYAFHFGGSNVALIDGSARFISQSVPIATVAKLLTRAGGDKIKANEEY